MTFPNLHSGVQYHQLPFTSASQPPKYGIVCRTTQRAVVQRIVVTNFNYTLLRSMTFLLVAVTSIDPIYNDTLYLHIYLVVGGDKSLRGLN